MVALLLGALGTVPFVLRAITGPAAQLGGAARAAALAVERARPGG